MKKIERKDYLTEQLYRQKIINTIHNLRKKNYTYEDIADTFNSVGIVPFKQSPNAKWYAQAICRIFTDEKSRPLNIKEVKSAFDKIVEVSVSEFEYISQYKSALYSAMKKLRSLGASLKEIHNHLVTENVVTGSGAGTWHTQSVHKILTK